MGNPIKLTKCRACQVRAQAGFTYVLLLWWVVLGGVTLAALGTSWQLMARRDNEAELIWRGEQYRRALSSYARVSASLQVTAAASLPTANSQPPAGLLAPSAEAALAAVPASGSALPVANQASQPVASLGPRELKELLEDKRSGKMVRHLRRLYPDPITHSPLWGIERAADGRISGVYSLSEATPVRPLPGVKRYRDLIFRGTGMMNSRLGVNQPAASAVPALLPAASAAVNWTDQP